MPLKTRYPVQIDGNTVPYPSRHDEIRCNYGFLDLRGKPELVDEVPETLESLSLKRLLTILADPLSQIMTVGCDLGEHIERKRQLSRRHVAGGYIQIAPLPVGAADKERLLAIARVADTKLRADSKDAWWEVDFKLSLTAFEFDDHVEAHTIWIWFFASASTSEKALSSREALLSSLCSGLKAAAGLSVQEVVTMASLRPVKGL